MVDHAFFGEDAVLHHVGIAVRSIADASPEAELIENRTQGVSMAFVRVNGLAIELLEPLGDNSPIERSLREGVKLLHLCFEVADLDVAVESCRPVGFHRVSAPVRVPEFENRRIVWVFSRDYGLVELMERLRGEVPGRGAK